MKNHPQSRLATYLLLLFFSFSIAAQSSFVDATATPEKAGFSTERLGKLDDFLQGLVDDEVIPNAVTFVARRGQIIHHKAYGHRDIASKAPAKTDDIFRIASQTKALVTVALLTFYEEGKFLPEDPIEKYLPEFAQPRVLDTHDPESLEFTTRPASRSITVRDLMTHTAGIPYDHPLAGRPEFDVPYFASLKPLQLEEVIKKIAARPLIHDPGTKFTYGLNTDILGRLVEVLSGQKLNEVLSERIFEPIGMKDSYFFLPADKHNRLVSLYSKLTAEAQLTVHENETYRNFATSGAQTYLSGGAGSVGTIEDYAKFCQMLLNRGSFNGQRILAPKTVDMMTSPRSNGQTVWNRRDPYGYGVQVISPDSHYGDQATPGSYTWGGMYLSEYTIDPTEELVMLLYTNVHPIPQYSEVVRKFRILVYAALVDP
ncbi:serine hydrolase [Lewinellaceae bacterium SD302]|nr:serine hydrolase [Lewinellaceae bacterium SD302]